MARHKTHRSDINQPEIVDALRKAGVEVHVIDRPVDLLCGYGGRWVLLEVKTEKGTLTPDQDKFLESPQGPVFIVKTPEEAINVTRKVSSYR
jgi:hypothetical protein